MRDEREELKKQVVSLELAKRLKTLGLAVIDNPHSFYKQPSQIEHPFKYLFYWFHSDERIEKVKPRIIYVKDLYDFIEDNWHLPKYKKFYNYAPYTSITDCQHEWKYYNMSIAFTVAELGMALPLTTWFNHSEREFEVHDVNAKKDFVAGNEAEARGLMWEYLKKNGLLKEKNEKT